MKIVRITALVLLVIAAALAGWHWRAAFAKRPARNASATSASYGPGILKKASPSPMGLGISQTFVSRGVAFFEQGEFIAAIECFSDALAADPTSANTYFLRANAFWQLQLLGPAIADLSKAIEAEGQPFYYYSRCGAFYSVGAWDAAISDCSETISLEPKEAEAYLMRAATYYAKGDLDRALADTLVVLMIRRVDPNARQLMDEILAAKELKARGGSVVPTREPSAAPVLVTEPDAGR